MVSSLNVVLLTLVVPAALSLRSNFAMEAKKVPDLTAKAKIAKGNNTVHKFHESLPGLKLATPVPLAVVDPGNKSQMQIDLGNGNKLWIMSVLPVFSPKESFISMLQWYNEKTWNETLKQDHYCRFPNGQRVLVEKYGGEEDVTYSKWMMTWRCKADYAEKDKACHTLTLENADGAKLGDVTGCHNVKQSQKGDFKVAACVRQPWDDGFAKMPQWLEYSVRHGVEQFYVYTRKSQPENRKAFLEIMDPYFRAGLATLIEVNDQPLIDDRYAYRPQPQYIMGNYATQVMDMNDCLHRAKYRAEWLLASNDIDEYLHFSHHNSSFPEALDEVLAAYPKVNSVSFKKHQFLITQNLEDMQISATMRRPDFLHQCSKYFARPDRIRVMFVHWPTSWEHGTENHWMDPNLLVGYHYGYNPDSTPKTCTTYDDSMKKEHPNLEKQLEERYPNWHRQLAEWKELAAVEHQHHLFNKYLSMRQVMNKYVRSSFCLCADQHVERPTGKGFRQLIISSNGKQLIEK